MGSDRVMKDSGVEWIGDIPEDWELRRLKLTVDLINDKTEYNGQTYIGLENIESGCGKYLETENQTIDGVSNSFSTGDILFGKLRPYLAKCIIAPCDGLCSSELLVIRNFKGNQQFLFWTLLSHWFINIVDASTYGAKMPRASWNFIRDLKICYPSRPGQNRIASFLNTKCSQIDSTIHKEREVIDKLKEYRQAVITEAVTKGIRPGVPMKESGVEWIGEIPEGWDVIPLKYSVKCNNQVLSEKTDEDAQIFYIDIGSVSSDGNISEVQNLSFKEAPSRARRVVYENDTIISTVRTYLKAIAFISTSYNNFIVSTGFAVLTPQKQYNPRYFYYALRADWFISFIESNSVGISYPAINSEKLMSFSNIVPPLPTQDFIASYLDTKCSDIDATIQKRELAIEKLTQYKQSLIYECVTGKKEVLG
jgi:type I restriction enzyme S subunit